MEPRQRLTFAAIAAIIAVVAVVLLVAGGGSEDGDRASGPQNPTTDTGSETTPPPDTGGAEAEPGDATATATATPTAEPQPAIPVVRVRGGEPAGGVKEIEVKQGQRIRFRVVSDVADEVHFHGYDVSKDVAPGEDVTFNVKATITGIFEAELEQRGVQIASIRVDP